MSQKEYGESEVFVSWYLVEKHLWQVFDKLNQGNWGVGFDMNDVVSLHNLPMHRKLDILL